MNPYVILQMHCCGYRAPTDWDSWSVITMPQSCCAADVAYCSAAVSWPSGCSAVVERVTSAYGRALAGLLLGSAALYIAGFVCGGLLATRLRLELLRSCGQLEAHLQFSFAQQQQQQQSVHTKSIAHFPNPK